MRSRNRKPRQDGFTLIEVMIAASILSIFVLGLGGFWALADKRADELILRQKAIFVINGEMERLSSLYAFTEFGDSAPANSTGYGSGSFPSSRLVYPSSVSSYTTGSPNEFTTTSGSSFGSGSEFQVYIQNSSSNARRNYVWIDKARGIAGRLSWSTSDINVLLCVGPWPCRCANNSGSTSGWSSCRVLELYLEYPFTYTSPSTITAPASLKSVVLKTIVGHT